ncbi:MAG: hypothetical protein LBG64_00260 [Pseudomonadales bacterium]|jgi:F0F1-type ATP synthase assembly protein I|nr:hypothetical protein [Pseudomonadales bacterium]
MTDHNDHALQAVRKTRSLARRTTLLFTLIPIVVLGGLGLLLDFLILGGEQIRFLIVGLTLSFIITTSAILIKGRNLTKESS